MHWTLTRRCVSRTLSLIAVVGSQVIAACNDLTAPFPSNAVEITPPAPYARWWAMTESCSGLSGDMSAVHFYAVPEPLVAVGDSSYAGYWRQKGNRIALAEPYVTDGAVVRHEMLHQLLQRGDHPRPDFVDRCGGIVSFGGGRHEEASALLAGPVPSSPVLATSDFQIELTLSPQPVRLGAPDSGWVTATVLVTNPRNVPVWVRIPRPSDYLLGFTLGVDVLGLDVDGWLRPFGTGRYSADTLMAFGARETKRQAVDVKLDASLRQWRARARFNDDTSAWQEIVLAP